MADGQPTYSQNANAAAASVPNCAVGGCPACQKVGLPMLLVRPGVADAGYARGRLSEISPLLKGVADPAIAHSGYVMRTLRAGFVMAYYEKAHTPEIKTQQGWQCFKVHDGGYLTPYPLDTPPGIGGKAEETFSCSRTAAYATAMLFVVPDARNTRRVWLGFSDHPWSVKVRDKYAGDEALRTQRMACVDASEARCERSLALTEARLRAAVADYDPELPRTALAGNPFAPLPASAVPGMAGQRPERAADLVSQAKAILRAARGVGFTLDDAMIVSIPDPVGVTTETAQRRLTLCNSAADWLAQQKDGSWRLTSALSIEGLLKELDRRGEQRKAANAAAAPAWNGRPMSLWEFQDAKARNALPPEAVFTHGLIPGPKGEQFPDNQHGTVSLPSATQVTAETRHLKDSVLAKLGRDADLPHRTFLQSFNAKAEADRKTLARIEQDHGVWLTCAGLRVVTDNDFDDACHADGVYYAGMVSRITLGGPLTDAGLAWYRPLVKEDPTDKGAFLTRALLGNQASHFGWFKEIEQQADLFDIAKTLFDLDCVDEALGQRDPWAKMLAASYAHPILGVVGATAAGMAKAKQLSPSLLHRLQALTGVVAGKSARVIGGTQLALAKVHLPVIKAAYWWGTMLGAARANVVHSAGQGSRATITPLGLLLAQPSPGASAMVDVLVWTSLETPSQLVGAAASGSMAAVRNGISAVGNVDRYLVTPAFANLNRAWSGASQWASGAQFATMGENSMALLKNGNAVLAAAAGVMQMLEVIKATGTIATGSEKDRQSAVFSLLAAGLGVAGAALEISNAVAEQLQRKALAQGLKVVGGSLAAVASGIDFVAAAVNASVNAAEGDSDARDAYAVQAFLYLGATAAGTGAVAFGGSATAISATGFSIGIGLSFVGWILVFVGLALLVGFAAQCWEDTATEEWAAKSIWGNSGRNWGSALVEQRELNKLLLGVLVEFKTKQFLVDPGQSPLAHKEALPPARLQRYVRMAELRVVLPKALRDQLQYTADIYPIGSPEQTAQWELVQRDRPRVADGPGFKSMREDVGDAIITTVQMDSAAVRGFYAKVRVAGLNGEVLVDETLR